MNEKLISLDTAKKAKEKGFDEKTWDYYWKWQLCSGITSNGEIAYNSDPDYKHEFCCAAPTQSLLQKWLRDEHMIFVSVERCYVGSDEWEFGYFIDWLPKEHHEDKRRSCSFKEIRSFEDNYPYSYSGAWYTWEQALEEGLKKSLELL